MDVAGRTKVFERRNFAIEALKHEVVAALKTAARGRVACVASEFVELVSDPADDAVEPALNGWMCGADKNWRREFFVEHQGSVVHLDDARDRQADISGFRRLADFVGQPRIGDLNFLLDAQVGGRIDHGLGAHDVARRVLRLLRAHLARVVRPSRHHEPDELACGRLRRRDRRRRRAFRGKIEQSAVRHDARRPAQSKLALLREIAVDFQPREAPWVRGYMPRSAFDRVFEIAVPLLQMVRA